MRILLLLTLTVFYLQSSISFADDAVLLMQRSFDSNRVIGSSFNAELELIAPSGQVRRRQTENSTRLESGKNSRITRFTSPADIKGTATLLIENPTADDDMWIYLPALKKVRRLIASNKRDSYVGTDFTFGDVLGHRVADWNHKLAGTSRVDGQECTLIESTPKSDAVRTQTGYSKRLSCVERLSAVALRTDFWDEVGKPLKWIQTSELKAVDQDGHWQPMQLKAFNLQSSNQTVIRLSDYRVDRSIAADQFRANRLESNY